MPPERTSVVKNPPRTADIAQVRRKRGSLRSLLIRDTIIFFVVIVAVGFFAQHYDAFERFAEWSEAHEAWEIDEIAIVAITAVILAVVLVPLNLLRALREARSTNERLRRRELELVASEERFTRAFESAATGMALLDANTGRFVRVNPETQAMLGRSDVDLSRSSLLDVTHPDDREAGRRAFHAVARDETAATRLTTRYIRGDGEVRRALVSLAAVRDSDGHPSYVVGQAIDVTEEEVAKQRLVDQIASKDELIATVSHELRTPLAGIVGYAELLSSGDHVASEQRVEMAKEVAEQAQDLAHIVEDLLIATRDERDISVASVVVDLSEEATRAVASIPIDEATRRGITISASAALALGDPTRVRQIVRNLLTNAIRHGGDTIEIRIDDADSMVALAVVDDGPGVTPEEAAHVFEPYQRGRPEEGLTASVGLGLTVSRRLAHLMDGDLTYRRLERTSVFELRLPRAVPSPTNAPAAVADAPRA